MQASAPSASLHEVEEGVVVAGEGAVVVKPAITQFLGCNSSRHLACGTGKTCR